jgi:hypothetical protein
MGARMTLQIKGVVEPLAAEGAEVPLHVTVALHVPVQQPLQRKRLLTHPKSYNIFQNSALDNGWTGTKSANGENLSQP